MPRSEKVRWHWLHFLVGKRPSLSPRLMHVCALAACLPCIHSIFYVASAVTTATDVVATSPSRDIIGDRARGKKTICRREGEEAVGCSFFPVAGSEKAATCLAASSKDVLC